MAHAIDIIHHPDHQLLAGKENGIEHQAVVVESHQQIDNEQLQYGIEHRDIGKGRHLLMGNDGSIIGEAHDIDNRRNNAQLVDPERRVEAVGRYYQLLKQKP